MDSYLLFGFGQCYAAFYNKEHPEVALEPMTEYRKVFDEKFGRPTTFLAAIRRIRVRLSAISRSNLTESEVNPTCDVENAAEGGA